ncbi:MAG TPA: hypothetical protein VJU86_08325 [Pyrinomonadaceae bacterium]|nr:hypothetical protein [Pyrinomonadaceae bacterium]
MDPAVLQLSWNELSPDQRDALIGRLRGLWGAPNDRSAFEALTVDKQQALLLVLSRMQARNLWSAVRRVTNVYGEGGVGIGFEAWPVIKSMLERSRFFTRLFANHKDTTGGFYEKRRSGSVLHFLYVDGEHRTWFVHFDLHSPVHSPVSAWRHLRYEFIGKVTPDWRMILKGLNS